MNIWIINHYAIPPTMGGLVRHYYFSKYLTRKSNNVRIFTASKVHNTEINMIKDKSLFKVEKIQDVEYTFVKSSDYKGNGIDRIINLIKFPFSIRKACKKFSKVNPPDVIYTSSPEIFTAAMSVLIARRLKVPVVVEVRDLWPESIVSYSKFTNKNILIKLLYQMEKWIYKKADRIIFTMEGGKDYIKEKGWDKKIDLSKVFHVNNGVDLDEFNYNKKNYILNDKDLLGDKFNVIYTGSIRKANNIESLVNIAKELKDRKIEDIQILIYGDGNSRKALEERIQELNLTNVKFKGRVDKKYIPFILSTSKKCINCLYYKRADVFKYGGSQNKLFEYFASGRPILSNVFMGYDLIKKYNAGSIMDIESEKEITEEIIKYSNMSEAEYMFFCENAKKASEDYEYNKLAEEIEKILHEIVELRK